MNKPKYFLYARKSTEDDDKQVMSIPAQLTELREFASRENLEIVGEFQESKSAKSPGREVFGKMMLKIESMDGVGILAWHPDRLARNSIDGGRIIYAVDTSKVISLRFPTFWFEPTPQGLFMLQVAFGQSKYYSDNLKQNVERGFRQKLRRGEWLTRAPFGYVNNPITHNIEPDSVKSKIIVRAFEAYLAGSHTLMSLSQFLADHGVTQKSGTPLVKASVQRMLSNRAYLGLVKHHGEFFTGSFAPILSPTLFEAVQKRLGERAHPRHSKISHNFPFTGLFRCTECGSMISAQWATGKCGGRYRYYRCSKKHGICTQSYLREDLLVSQVREQLQSVSLPESWAEYMLQKVDILQSEESHASGSRLGQMKEELKGIEAKLDALVDLYLNKDIERKIYLVKKDVLMRQKLSLQSKSSSVQAERKNWVEPLRKWILDSKRAGFLSSGENLHQMRDFLRSFGTNPALKDKTISISFCPPSEFARTHTAECRFPCTPAPRARGSIGLSEPEVSICGVYWTKFECISGKIRRILTTNRTRGARGDLKLLRTLRLRGEAIQCASDTLADSRVQKPKNFLAFFSRLLPPPLRREAEKEMERKFLVLLRRFSLRKEQSYFNIFVCSFLHPHGDRGASSPRYVVALNLCGFDTDHGNS